MSLSSSEILLLPLSNDPRFTQCIYRYSHASKRFVEVFYTKLFVNILDLDQVRRLSGLVCVQAVNGNDLWWQPKLLPPIQWVAAGDMYDQTVWNRIRRNFMSGLIRF